MKRALLVGINAYPLQPLLGCVNDALDIAGFVANRRWAGSGSIKILLDAAATKCNILEELGRLIEDSKACDELYFHFSGHGTQIDTNDPDELDGLDELMCPVDINLDDARGTAISDDELNAKFRGVVKGVAATWSVDACSSGDLTRRLRWRLRSRFMPSAASAHAQEGRAISRRVVRKFSSAVDDTRVAFIAACSEVQEAAELDLGGRPNGAFSYCLLRQLELQHEFSPQAAQEESLADLVERVGRNVDLFHMTPKVSGPEAILKKPFLLP